MGYFRNGRLFWDAEIFWDADIANVRIFIQRQVYASLRTLDSLYKQSRQPQQSPQSLQVLHWVNF